MGCMDANERAELVDLVAQAVIDKMEERTKINMLADVVIQRIIALQQQEAALNSKPEESASPTSEKEMHNAAT